jgi:hypothetical protein
MQENHSSSTLSLSQRAYLIAESFRQISHEVFIAYLFTILLLNIKDPKDIAAFNIVVISAIVLLLYIRARTFYRNFDHWNEDYLQQEYVLIFSTTIQKGNTSVEKVLNLTSQIFPELRPDYLNIRFRRPRRNYRYPHHNITVHDLN